MIDFKIESNIPQPKGCDMARRSYPFKEMKVGDSFLVEGLDEIKRARSAAINYGRYHGKKFVTRSKDGSGRIWRVS